MYAVVFAVCSLTCVQLLCSLMNCSPPGSSVHGISQARTLEWFSISSSRGSTRPRDQTHISCKSPALQVSSLHTDPLGKPHSDIKVIALQIFIVLPMSSHCVRSLLFSLTLKKKKTLKYCSVYLSIIGNEAESEGS